MLGYISGAFSRRFSTENVPLSQASTPAQPLSSLRAEQVGNRTAVILLVGRCGSGKTFFVETAYSDQDIDPAGAPIDKTSTIVTSRITISGQRFKLVDTPGFDNPTMGSFETFSRLAQYLLDKKKFRVGITGVVYIHRAGDPLEGRALNQNLGVLFDVLLGDTGLSRLTIMVVPEKSGTHAPASTAQALSQASVFRAALTKGAKVVASTLRRADIDTILASCVEQDPVWLRVQQERIHNPKTNIGTQIEERLGYYEKDSMLRRLAPYQKQVHSLENTLKGRNSRITDLSDANEQIEQQLTYTQGELSKTRQQLQQTQQEYASLRSKLQLHENTEQGDIVQTLKDLNRGIDDLGRSVSEYLVDTYVQAVFGKEAGDVITLDARNLPDLKGLLGHADDNPSLVVSSDGTGMPIEDFLDYAMRMLLCERLCRRIFDRFHPVAELSQDQTVAAMYEDVQRREPQAIAAKWRSNSFKSLCRGEDADAATHHINLITQELIDECFTPLVTHLFGQEAGVGLSDQCSDRLKDLVRTAWDWNSVLKGEVIMLGDFRLVYYIPSCQFDPNLMTEFEADRQNPEPRVVAGTLGLGLLSFKAVGGGEMPERTVVYKAVVATENLYA